MANSSIGVVHIGRVFRRAVGAAAISCLAACGGGGGAPDIASPEPDTRADDRAVAALVYSPEQRTPASFYQEADRYPDRSVFRFHVNSDDIGVPASVAFEVCTNDFSEALSWSSSGADARAFSTELTGNTETRWFFEFDRAVNSATPAMVINRVFKCSALDREGAQDEGFAGQLMARPLGSDELRFVAEYMWQFSRFNNALHAVIDSTPGSESGALTHTLRRAEVRSNAGAVAGCDRVEIWQWQWRADSTNGALESTQRFERAFDARLSNGIAELCDG